MSVSMFVGKIPGWIGRTSWRVPDHAMSVAMSRQQRNKVMKGRAGLPCLDCFPPAGPPREKPNHRLGVAWLASLAGRLEDGATPTKVSGSLHAGQAVRTAVMQAGPACEGVGVIGSDGWTLPCFDCRRERPVIHAARSVFGLAGTSFCCGPAGFVDGKHRHLPTTWAPPGPSRRVRPLPA